jgi:hypothetical protein
LVRHGDIARVGNQHHVRSSECGGVKRLFVRSDAEVFCQSLEHFTIIAIRQVAGLARCVEVTAVKEDGFGVRRAEGRDCEGKE